MSDTCVLESQVRTWLRPEILDAEESRRTWRLRCIQADAELRNLKGSQAQGSSVGSDICSPRLPDDGAGDATSPACTKLVDDRESVSPGSPSPALDRSFTIVSPRVSMLTEGETQETLAKVLALERHIAELSNLIAHTDRDVSSVREQAKSLEERLSSQRASAEHAAANTATANGEAQELEASQSRILQDHAQKCETLQQETEDLKLAAGCRESVESELRNARVEKEEFSDVLERCVAELENVFRQRERLRMANEEVRTKRCDMLDSHNQCTREVATAKQQAKSRSAALSRLQGEVLRIRSRSERKRRVLEGQLSQCRGELADATGKATTASEQLRKTKQHQGKQIRELRTESDVLRSEVDEHLLAIRTSEADVERVQNEEAELDSAHSRHATEEHTLQLQAADFRKEATRLEHEIDAREAYAELGFAKLQKAEEELSEEEQLCKHLRAGMHSLEKSAEEIESDSEQIRHELYEEQQLSSLRGEEITRLDALQTMVEVLKAKNGALSTEHTQLQDSAKQSHKSSEKHYADMQEAARRASRLKAQHTELLESVPAISSRGRDGLILAMEQTIGKITKKVDAVMSCLESSGQSISVSQKSQAALHRRLQVEHERGMEVLLAEERRKVVVEQQRSLTEARRRTVELQSARQERRRLEENLVRCQQARDWARRSSESELQGLEAQVKLVDREATEGAEAVTAEFSDLLQKQALERNVLQAQVDELRGQMDETDIANRLGGVEPRADEELAPEAPVRAILAQQLTDLEAEAKLLRAEEEELRNKYVKLKAAVVASKQRLQEAKQIPVRHSSS